MDNFTAPRSYLEDLRGDRVSYARGSIKRELEPGGRGIAIIGAVTRKRLITD
jgi:hypothetical protein